MSRYCSRCGQPYEPVGRSTGKCRQCQRIYERDKSRHRRERRTRNCVRWQQARAAARRGGGERCRRCGSADRLEVHHIVPLSAGGQPFALSNLITLCSRCHHDVERGRETVVAKARSHPSPGFRETHSRDRLAEHHSQASPEEAQVAADEIVRLLGTPYRDEDGERALGPEDVVIVAPYNADVRCLRQHIPDQRIRIGTVDKFQGQQAPVVFYSMASSSADDVPRGLDFLFSRKPPQRRHLACQVPRAPRLLAAAPRCELPHNRADAARERVVPAGRVREWGRGEVSGAEESRPLKVSIYRRYAENRDRDTERTL